LRAPLVRTESNSIGRAIRKEPEESVDVGCRYERHVYCQDDHEFLRGAPQTGRKCSGGASARGLLFDPPADGITGAPRTNDDDVGRAAHRIQSTLEEGSTAQFYERLVAPTEPLRSGTG
jgi:hypothetical protein